MIWATTQQYANAAHEMATVNDHRLKAVASSYGLKPDCVGPEGRLVA